MPEIFQWLWAWLDAFLIGPYRWPAGAMAGWWLGTSLLAIWATLLGELTMAVGRRVNRRRVTAANDEVTRMHQASINALRQSDKAAWRGINRLGNEAVGKAFFLQVAMGAGSLWPAFMALGWLGARFEGVALAVPLFTDNYIAGFLLCYLPCRLLLAVAKKLWTKRR
ncbi:conserved hypothetical protein [Desulfarculus baarsii DSM 2075]|uniref:Uncharacterized protein n=1 Tax=Desulfarculus baarsii (strain ATCC 33931 / DSM 2075 / LMG 7858 / VKM B-1802 / 2st14) TaxID=644282 RepID=E1QEV5_DESB2|nr:hypothetical protein [Desulfarculus baarsii]ADK84091.1 conserved hypothetical protein [Desulfarculus baarsii DSM 2075]